MNGADISRYVFELESKAQTLTEQLEMVKKRSIDSTRFSSGTMTVAAIADLHGVHRDTVRKYIELGLIPKHPDSTDAKLLVSGAVGVSLDFDALRRESKFIPYN